MASIVDRGSEEASTRRAGQRAKEVGLLAQKEASLLFSRAGLTVNESHEDTEGWDLFVQFPTSLDVTDFLDMISPARSCLVQVKAHEQPGARVRMTLSNALKLATATTAAFVLVAHVLGDRIAAIRLVHYDEAFIAAVLERAAKAPSAHQSALNKIFVDVPDGTAVEVGGAPLRAALLTHLGHDPQAYWEQKQAWLRDVGYGPARKKLRVAVSETPTDASYERMADFAVGHCDSLPVRSVDVVDLRFGMERHERRLEHAEMTWPNVPTGPTADVILSAGHDVLRFHCTSHLASAVFPFLPRKFDRMVLRAQYCSFTLKKSDAGTTVSWSFDGFGAGFPVSALRDAAQVARCMRLFREPSLSLQLETVDRRVVKLGRIGLASEELPPDLRHVEDMAIIAQRLDLPSDFFFELAKIQHHGPALRPIAAALGGEDADVNCVFSPGEPPGNPGLGDVCGLITVLSVRIASATLVCATALVGPIEAARNVEGMHGIYARRLRLLGTKVVNGETDADADAMADDAATALKQEGVRYVYSSGDRA